MQINSADDGCHLRAKLKGGYLLVKTKIIHQKFYNMNLLAPVSSIMTKKLITVNPEDKLIEVKRLFDEHKIHHLPVVRFTKIVGIISKTDLLYFLKGLGRDESGEAYLNEVRLSNYTAEEIMTSGMAKLEPEDRINVALEVFKINMFHALPVVKNDELVGILTTYDIIKTLANEKVSS